MTDEEFQNQRQIFIQKWKTILENFEDKIPTGNSYSLEKSQAFVDNYGNGEYKPLLFHSPDILRNEVGFLTVYEG